MNSQMEETAYNSTMSSRHEETRRLKKLLYSIIGVAFVSTATIWVVEMLRESIPTKIALTAVLGIELFIMWLIWREHLLIPRISIPWVAFFIATYQCVTSYGIRDNAMLAFPLSIIFSGLLLGPNWIIVFSVLSMLTVNGITYAEISGMLNTAFSAGTAYENIVILDALLFFTGMIFYIAVRDLDLSLFRLREGEASLVEDKQALMVTQAELEQKVIERTRNLEAARKETEEANRALQAQMWQISGLAQLSDTMRGDQDSILLAHNVMRQLCQYLDLPIGALYLLEAELLTLASSYAYVNRKHLANRFAIGQGLVGQVAKEQSMIILSQVPSDYITVRSAVAEFSLGQILAIPFLYDDQVIGVIELGTTNTFTEPQIRFLEAAVANIAIAFHTAQARARIDALLAGTQETTPDQHATRGSNYVEEN